MKLNKTDIIKFQKYIWQFYQESGRFFVWRNIDNPYYIVVSEIMLQQTQTSRIEEKYKQFITQLPTFLALANAPLQVILQLWQGLGYNRRGLYLQQIAQKVVHEYNEKLPDSPEILQTFPGIGHATASSICAFAFNKPTVFIETNIRAVFIYEFFKNNTNVTDVDIIAVVGQTIDKSNPREWYYALMDYGVMLKKKYPNPSRKSAHYIKQSKFDGSDRQIRGKIITLLTQKKYMYYSDIFMHITVDEKRLCFILQQLCNEQLVSKNKNEQFFI